MPGGSGKTGGGSISSNSVKPTAAASAGAPQLGSSLPPSRFHTYLYSGSRKHVVVGLLIVSAMTCAPWLLMTSGSKHQSHADYMDAAEKARQTCRPKREIASMGRFCRTTDTEEEILEAIPGWDDVQQAGKAIDDTPSQPSKPADDSPSQLLWPRDGSPSELFLGKDVNDPPCQPSKPIGEAELLQRDSINDRPIQVPWAGGDGEPDDLFGDQSASQLQVERGVFDATGSTLSDPSQEPVEWLSPEDAEDIFNGLTSTPLPSTTPGGRVEMSEEDPDKGGPILQRGADLTCYTEGFESDRSHSPRGSPSKRRLSWNLPTERCTSLREEEAGIPKATPVLLADLPNMSLSKGKVGSSAESEAEGVDGADLEISTLQIVKFTPLRGVYTGDREQSCAADGLGIGSFGCLHGRVSPANREEACENKKQQHEIYALHDVDLSWRSFPLVLVPPPEQQHPGEYAAFQADEDLLPSKASLSPRVRIADPHESGLIRSYPILPRENFPHDSEQDAADAHEAQAKSSRDSSPEKRREELGQEETSEPAAGNGLVQWVPRFLNLRQPPPAVQEKLNRLRSRKNERNADHQNLVESEIRGWQDCSVKRKGPPLVPETVLEAIRIRAYLQTKKFVHK